MKNNPKQDKWREQIKPLKIEKKEKDYTIHGKKIEARTFPFLLPMMTTAKRDAMGSPQKGQMIFNTDTGRVNIYNGHSWEEMIMSTTSSSSSSSSTSSISTTTT